MDIDEINTHIHKLKMRFNGLAERRKACRPLHCAGRTGRSART